MAEQQERTVRLKFKRFLLNGGPLMPQGYRLATVEEIRTNLDMFRTRELPVKRIAARYKEGGGDIRLLDGWVPSDFSDVKEEFNHNCSWNAVVKKKVWNGTEKKWRNSSDLYSSAGFSLRERLYNGINLSSNGEETAWLHAYCYRDVELLYWLWETYPHSIASDHFKNERGTPYSSMDIDHTIPLRKIVISLEDHEARFEPPMANGEEKAVWEDASKRERDAGHRYVYGPTWGVAMVELAIKIYGQPFKNTASSIDFKKPECVPIITKVLSLLSPNQLKNQIDNLQVPVAEVLIEAVKRGYTELVDDLLKRRDEGEVGEEEKMLFHYALPHEPVFSLLYVTYASSSDDIITIQDKFGRNVLHLAAKGDFNSRVVDRLFGRFPLAEKLILSKDQQRRTPLHIAASKGNTRIINKILQDHFGTADSPEKINYIQATDSSGRTALQIAASEGHDELVRMLMDQGSCPLRERDGQKKTALHHAAQVKILRAALATCKALLEHDRLSSSKCSLLLWASATGIGTADEMEHVHEDVKRYLRKKKGEYREPLLEAAAINNEVEMAWELLSRGADFAGIHDLSNRLQSPEKESVEKVLRQMEHIKEQGRDQPSMEDKLGTSCLIYI